MYGFDTFSITPALTLTYGGRYARYDYLEASRSISPRVALTFSPSRTPPDQHGRVPPGGCARAEEFVPPGDNGIWLPPQRTFSSLSAGRPLEAERSTNHSQSRSSAIWGRVRRSRSARSGSTSPISS